MARADSVSDPIGPAAALSDMQAARLLIRAGRLDHARAFLEQAAPSTDAERIERLFLLGRIEMRLGLPAAAAQRFEAALAIRPDLPRVRLELARAYFLAGVDDRARHHFRLSLDNALPSSVEAIVETLLRRLDVRERWSASVSAAMLPVTERSQRDTVRIGGVPFRLNQDAKSSSGHGALLGGGASYSHPLPGRLRGVLATSGAAKLYERSDWNEVTATGEAGLRISSMGEASLRVCASRVCGARVYPTGSVSAPGSDRVGVGRRRRASTCRWLPIVDAATNREAVTVGAWWSSLGLRTPTTGSSRWCLSRRSRSSRQIWTTLAATSSVSERRCPACSMGDIRLAQRECGDPSPCCA